MAPTRTFLLLLLAGSGAAASGRMAARPHATSSRLAGFVHQPPPLTRPTAARPSYQVGGSVALAYCPSFLLQHLFACYCFLLSTTHSQLCADVDTRTCLNAAVVWWQSSSTVRVMTAPPSPLLLPPRGLTVRRISPAVRRTVGGARGCPCFNSEDHMTRRGVAGGGKEALVESDASPHPGTEESESDLLEMVYCHSSSEILVVRRWWPRRRRCG